MLEIDWKRFEGLKAYLLAYLKCFHHQVATAVAENRLVLALLQTVYHLLRPVETSRTAHPLPRRTVAA